VPSSDQLCPPLPIKISQIGDLPPLLPDSTLPCDPTVICKSPDAPELIPTGEPQTIKVRAKPFGTNIPAQYTTFNIWVEHFSSSLGWQMLYQHESYDAIARAGSSGTHVEFEANGLIPGEAHRFLVSFCRKTTRKGCNCWSGAAQSAAQTSNFPASPLPLPTGVSIPQRARDPFSDLITTQRSATPPGDGWGPASVWDVSNGDLLSLDYDADGTFAEVHRLRQSARALLTKPANSAVSFTEAEFEPLCTVSPTPDPKPNPPSETDCDPDGTIDTAVNYRVDVETQYNFGQDICRPSVPNAQIAYEYFLQVAYEPDWGVPINEPSLRLIRVGPGHCPAPPAQPEYARYLIGNPAETGFVTIASLCTGDVSQLKNGSPVLARIIRVADENNFPKLFVQLGWGGCTGSSCAVKCTIDSFNGEPLVDDNVTIGPLLFFGRHAVTSHHWDTDFRTVSAGSNE
jgi:hypothetical protein